MVEVCGLPWEARGCSRGCFEAVDSAGPSQLLGLSAESPVTHTSVCFMHELMRVATGRFGIMKPHLLHMAMTLCSSTHFAESKRALWQNEQNRKTACAIVCAANPYLKGKGAKFGHIEQQGFAPTCDYRLYTTDYHVRQAYVMIYTLFEVQATIMGLSTEDSACLL